MACLTQLRMRLAESSDKNAEYLCLIESSICSLVLEDAAPADDVEFYKMLTYSAASNCWSDKSVEMVATKNGLFGSHSEVRKSRCFTGFVNAASKFIQKW